LFGRAAGVAGPGLGAGGGPSALDILMIEVLADLDQLGRDPFLIVYAPLPIVGLDSSPVRVVAIEGMPEL